MSSLRGHLIKDKFKLPRILLLLLLTACMIVAAEALTTAATAEASGMQKLVDLPMGDFTMLFLHYYNLQLSK